MQLSEQNLLDLKTQYEDLRGKTLDEDKIKAISSMLEKLKVETLEKISEMDIAIISEIALKKIPAREEEQIEEIKAEMKKDDAYAIGMAQAKKSMNDEPPLEKKTIKKGHEIAKKIIAKEEKDVPKGYHKMPDGKIMKDSEHKKEELGKEDEPKVKQIIKKLKGASQAHAGQAKELSKALQNENKHFTSQQIKMAYGVANDKRYKGGNYSGAVKAIEKIAKGLSDHPDVQKVLKRTNEDIDFKLRARKVFEDIKQRMKETGSMSLADIKRLEKQGMKPKDKKDEDLEEGRMKDIFTANKEGESAEEIAKRLKLPLKTVKDVLGESHYKVNSHIMTKDGKLGQIVAVGSPQIGAYYSVKVREKGFDRIKQMKADDFKIVEYAEITDKHLSLLEMFTSKQIKDLQKQYGDLRGKTISPEMATKISKHLDGPSYGVGEYKQLVKANIPFISTLARNKLYKKTGRFENAKKLVETITAVKNKAEKTGMPYGVLKKVYDRGMAAWKGGHRPGATQVQWALARVNSFVTKSSGTWGGADSDLAKQVRGSKK